MTAKLRIGTHHHLTMLATIGWHVAFLVAIVLILPYAQFQRPGWGLTGLNSFMLLGFAGAYAIGAVVLLLHIRPRIFQAEILAIGSALVVAALVMFLILLDGTSPRQYSRVLLVATACVAGAGLTGPVLWTFWTHAPRRAIISASISLLAFSLVAAVAAYTYLDWERLVTRTTVNTTTLDSTGHTLIATIFSGYVSPATNPRASGGAISQVPGSDEYILVTADGRLFRVAFESDGDLQLDKLEPTVPINREEFDADVAKDVPRDGFRVADIALRRASNGVVIYVSHHFWHRDRSCFSVRVSSLTLAEYPQAHDGTAKEWTTVFEASPCLPIKRARGSPFAGEQVGGNIEFLDDEHLLLTVGDHQFDGWYRDPNLVQEMSADYGKTIRIDLVQHESHIMTLGHRNPQGLAVSSNGRIWSTEHGPRGGDELNLLKEGGNYGYPYHTYGTEYGSAVWPVDGSPLENIDHELPVFSWVPSIAVTDLIAIQGDALSRWRGDLLIATLKGSLWRVRLREDARIAYAEPIEIGSRIRIRDLTSGDRGAIVLWTDESNIIRLTPATDVDIGSAIFAVRCGGCHDDTRNRIGPHLNDLFTRGIGSAEGYRFSEALESVDGDWTEERLDAFIAAPSKFAPGTRMTIEGIDDAKTRSKIIEYLRHIN